MSLDFERLYEAEYDRLLAYARKRISDPDDAADFASAVFLRAWEKRHHYRRIAGINPSSWLFCLARRMLVDHYRRDGRIGFVRLGTWQPFGEDAGSDEHIEKLHAQVAVSGALATYRTGNSHYPPHKHLAVIRERFFEGGTDKEIASRLGMTKPAVKKLRMRAMARLRKTLEGAA